MIKNGIINGDLASLLARFRHVNTIAIVDGPFPTYPNVETIDLALVMGTPTVSQVLDAILPHLDLTGMYLAAEFEAKVDAATVAGQRPEHRSRSGVHQHRNRREPDHLLGAASQQHAAQAAEADVFQRTLAQPRVDPVGEDALVGAAELARARQHAAAVDEDGEPEGLAVFERHRLGGELGRAVE